ncbi:MAG: RsiV family protein [Bacteroidaceae bacterium]|nr:RsiV family protein [Bacteroidaceae bacterium]
MRKLKSAGFSVALLMLCACNGNNSSSNAETAESQDSVYALPVEELLFHDSLSVVNTWCSEDIHVDYPSDTCSDALADSVRAWLVETLSTTNNIDWGEESNKKSPMLFAGDKNNGRECVDFYGCQGIKTLSETLRPMAEEGMDIPFENAIQLSVADSVPGLPYTTYSGYHYIYLGGAHGSTIGISQTFRNSDGRRMGWNMLDLSKKEQIVKLITKGIAEYFGNVDGNTVTEENVKDYLMLMDDPETPENELEYGIPLPASQPYVLNGAIHFTYQQYEIAAYASGMPDAAVAIEEIRDCLSEEGRALLLDK